MNQNQWWLPSRHLVSRLHDWQRMLLIGAVITLSSQLYLLPGLGSFRISTSVLLYPVLLVTLMRNLRHPYTGAVTACVVFFFRLIWAITITGVTVAEGVTLALPGSLFYLAYDSIFCLLVRDRRQVPHVWLAVSAFSTDILANLIEIAISLALGAVFPTRTFFLSLLGIAAIRGTGAAALLWGIRSYSKLLLREEHEQRYQRLFLMTAQMKDELYFLQKGTEEIETVMSKAYQLYEKMDSESDVDATYKTLALDITRDIHEIKKDHLRILKGIEGELEDVYDREEMKYSDLVVILEESTRRILSGSGSQVRLECEIGHDFSTREHYRLMSIVKNLVTNAIEACGNRGLVRFTQQLDGDSFLFIVEDNGPGIPQKVQDSVFDMGYSTRFDPVTGNINRGVGLASVRHITEIFGGKVTMESKENVGTVFCVSIPRAALEEEKNADIHH